MEEQQQVQQKRCAAEAVSLLEYVKAIVFDIEGTTTSITFTKDNLLPYARNKVEQHLKNTYEDAETIKDVKALRELAVKDKADEVKDIVEIPDSSDSKDDVVKAVAADVKSWIDNHRDCPELKQFLNHLWRVAYEAGEIPVEVFEDVVPMLRMLSDEHYALYVFADGNAETHKKHFAKTTEGDISESFKKYYDTSIGAKTDRASYDKIAAEIVEELKCKPHEILYLTGSPEEAEVAVGAGWSAALVIRPGNPELTDEHLQKFACIEQLDELYGDEDEEDFKRFHGEEEDDDEEEDEEENDNENDNDNDD